MDDKSGQKILPISQGDVGKPSPTLPGKRKGPHFFHFAFLHFALLFLIVHVTFPGGIQGLWEGLRGPGLFYSNITRVKDEICPSVQPGTPSYAGYIGLEGDSEENPKRSFFW